MKSLVCLRLRRMFCCGAALFSFLIVSSASSPATAQRSLEELIKEAGKEGRLTLMSGPSTWGSEEGVKAVQDAFNKKYGLNARVQFVPGPDMAQMAGRVLDENRAKEKSATDILAGTPETILRLIDSGAVETVPWQQYFPELNREMVELNGQVIQFYTQFPGVLYNTKRVEKRNLPGQLNDLLDPRWKGIIGTPPYTGHLAMMAFAIKELGIERMKSFYKAFTGQITGFLRCGEEQRVASGEFPIMFFACDVLGPIWEGELKKIPMGGVVLKDAALMVPAYFTIPRNASNPNMAKLWGGFVLSAEGNRIYERHTYNSSHLVPGSMANRYLKDQTTQGISFTTLRAIDMKDKLPVLLEYRKVLADMLKR